MVWLPNSEKIWKICLFVLNWSMKVMDRQTPHDDIGHTCIASYSKNYCSASIHHYFTLFEKCCAWHTVGTKRWNKWGQIYTTTMHWFHGWNLLSVKNLALYIFSFLSIEKSRNVAVPKPAIFTDVFGPFKLYRWHQNTAKMVIIWLQLNTKWYLNTSHLFKNFTKCTECISNLFHHSK